MTPPPIAAQSEPVRWQQLSPALQELLTSSSPAQIAAIAAKAARSLCDADAISLSRDCSSWIDSDPDPDPVIASVTLVAPGPQRHPAMNVNWYRPHTVSDTDRELLDILAQAAVLALRALPAGCADPPAAPFEPQERARFFDLQRQVRGLLAIVRSIVRRMADSSKSVEEYAAHLEGRLGAIARVQGFLLRAPGAAVDLDELVSAEFLAQSIRDEQLEVAGPRTLIDSKTAETLGLALHELSTNSIKFGALSRAAGRVQVLWRRDERDPRCILLDWHETGGPSTPPTLTKGFGFELIEQTLPYELGGRSSITLHPAGLHCLIAFAAPPGDSHAAVGLSHGDPDDANPDGR